MSVENTNAHFTVGQADAHADGAPAPRTKTAVDEFPARAWGVQIAEPEVYSAAPLWRGIWSRGRARSPHILIIDDFFADPWEQRRIALAREYEPEKRADANYGGRDAIETEPLKDTHLTAAHGIASILGSKIKFFPFYRINTAGTHDLGRANIHFDDYDGGIVYLNPPGQCEARAGTHFWRHKRCGWESCLDMRLALRGYTGAQLSDFFWNELKGGRDPSDWEPTLTVPMKWNRLVLFRGDLFHSTGQSFGSTKKDARLIQVIQFEIMGEHASPPRRAVAPK
ncbi:MULTISPECIES: DUF6445 family protein [Sorangium]|uniref:Prolyl 4-hydroxylase alpha subunit Fe(2+) 2OG dioxygenase domain-containing protein n=1 Tax=Sorangium cellulosum TaxID=56 RepID=A0A4P2QV46_SORCE|nr:MULTISPECIES: DUF6445 family protein [Sorangium]AUX34279.1 uncharacterized protein SOCE836_064500 [Sorangium cellulosum]WCQ93597.1 minor coat protein [Sorangium sp. Soce836]